MNKPVCIFLLTILLAACGLLGGDDEPAIEPVCTNSVAGEWTYLGLKEETVHSIAVHPKNPQIIFAGTGFDFSAERMGKIFRSTDCGESWELVYGGGSFREILFHPHNFDTLYALYHLPTASILRSSDGGDTWELHSEGMHTGWFDRPITMALLIHPETPERMYATTNFSLGSGNMYKSENGGGDWYNISDRFEYSASGRAMFLHPDQPDLLLLAHGGGGRISRSEDGGETWSSMLTIPEAIVAFALNPENPDQIVASAMRRGLFVSDNRGITWREQTVDIGIEPDDLFIRDITFINGNFYITIDGGILKSNDFENYEWMNEGIDIGQTEEGYSLTLPQTIVADPYAQNMYLGHWTIPDHLVEDGFGGIFVRRIE